MQICPWIYQLSSIIQNSGEIYSEIRALVIDIEIRLTQTDRGREELLSYQGKF